MQHQRALILAELITRLIVSLRWSEVLLLLLAKLKKRTMRRTRRRPRGIREFNARIHGELWWLHGIQYHSAPMYPSVERLGDNVSSFALSLSLCVNFLTLHPDSKIARNLRSSSINLNESRAECCARARVIALTRAKSKQNRAHAHVASKQKRVRNVRWIHVENCILSCGEREKIPEPDLDTSDLFIGSHLYSANFELFFKIFHSLPRCKFFFPLDIYNNL